MIWNHKFSFIICFYHLGDICDCHRVVMQDTLLQSFIREQHNTNRTNFLKGWGQRPLERDQDAGEDALPSILCAYASWDQVGGGGWAGTPFGSVVAMLIGPTPVWSRGCFLHIWSQVRGFQWDPWPLTSRIWGAWGLTHTGGLKAWGYLRWECCRLKHAPPPPKSVCWSPNLHVTELETGT